MTIGVIGGGAWGTALAQVMAAHEDVVVWAREAPVVTAINKTRQNADFLPGITLSPRIRATATTHDLADADLWLDRKSTRLNSSHSTLSRMPSSA